jgi:hypothetical protein
MITKKFIKLWEMLQCNQLTTFCPSTSMWQNFLNEKNIDSLSSVRLILKNIKKNPK